MRNPGEPRDEYSENGLKESTRMDGLCHWNLKYVETQIEFPCVIAMGMFCHKHREDYGM